MTETIDSAMLPFKIQELISIVMDKKRMSEIDAMYYLYTSRLYERMEDPSAKLWYESTLNLYETLEAENDLSVTHQLMIKVPLLQNLYGHFIVIVRKNGCYTFLKSFFFLYSGTKAF